MSFYGTGLDLVDLRPRGGDVYDGLRCLTVLWVPLLPLSTLVLVPEGVTDTNLGAVMLERRAYRLLRRERVPLRRALRVVGTGLAVAAAALAPFGLVMRSQPAGPPSDARFVVFMAAIVWPIVVLSRVDARRRAPFERPRGDAAGT